MVNDAATSRPSPKQAIVVIHGMGEQRPLDMLRAGANAAIPPRQDGPRLISRPDKVTDGYDARRYLARASSQHLQTEVYEYHWAHLMTGNKVSDVVPLVKRVMLRLPWQLPGKLFPIWLILWVIVAVALLLAYLTWDTAESRDINGILTAVGASGVLIFLVSQGVNVVANLLSSHFVDVVRYTDAAPRNQRVRDRIRRGAVRLLEGLNDSGRYDRIIVVAHSLGTFIAYDAIAYLWARKNKMHAWLDDPPNDALRRLEEVGNALAAGRATVEQFQEAQREAWCERRRNGMPWLITDFVCLGSPLAHSHILFAKNEAELLERQQRLEAPRCPPIADYFDRAASPWRLAGWHDGDQYSYTAGRKSAEGSWQSARVLYHAAPFALVRWTAIHLPMDPFANPLAPNFGPGIRDLEAKGQKLQNVPVMAHTAYFKHDDDPPDGSPVALFRDAVDLAAGNWLRCSQEAPEFDPTTA